MHIFVLHWPTVSERLNKSSLSQRQLENKRTNSIKGRKLVVKKQKYYCFRVLPKYLPNITKDCKTVENKMKLYLFLTLCHNMSLFMSFAFTCSLNRTSKTHLYRNLKNKITSNFLKRCKIIFKSQSYKIYEFLLIFDLVIFKKSVLFQKDLPVVLHVYYNIKIDATYYPRSIFLLFLACLQLAKLSF